MHFRKILLEQSRKGTLNEESVNSIINNYFDSIANTISKDLKKKKIPMDKLRVSKGNDRMPYGAVDFISYTASDFEAKIEIMVFLLNFDKIEVTIDTTRADWGMGAEKETKHFRFNSDEKEIVKFVVDYVMIQSLGRRS